MIGEITLDVLRNSILITGLVLIMMLLIEFYNIRSNGKRFEKLKGSPVKQVLTGSLLGLIPGCIGGFAAVSLYTHRLISFGALVAMMICSSGDEAFVILAMIPKEGLLLFALLFAIAVVSGIAVDRLFPVQESRMLTKGDDFQIHSNEQTAIPSILKLSSYSAMRRPTKERIIILSAIAIFIGAVIAGFLEHEHAGTGAHTHQISFNILSERWLNIIFALFSLVTLLFVATAKEHFIKEHLWNHIIKRHLPSIFLWTFGALLVCHIAMHYIDIEKWVGENLLTVLLVAVAIGLIPESGPHLIFVTLFAQGVIPFYILLANSMVQDGHTTLPLLAENKKTFLFAKLINLVLGLAVGLGCYLIF